MSWCTGAPCRTVDLVHRRTPTGRVTPRRGGYLLRVIEPNNSLEGETMKKSFIIGTMCAALTLGIAPAALATGNTTAPAAAPSAVSATVASPEQKNGIMKVKATFFNDTNRTLKLTNMGDLKPGESKYIDNNSDAAGIHYDGVVAWVENHYIGRPDFNVQADASDGSPKYVSLSESSGKYLECGGRKYYAHRHADHEGKQRFDIHILK